MQSLQNMALNFCHPDELKKLIQVEDVVNTVNYLLSMSDNVAIKEIVLDSSHILQSRKDLQ